MSPVPKKQSSKLELETTSADFFFFVRFPWMPFFPVFCEARLAFPLERYADFFVPNIT